MSPERESGERTGTRKEPAPSRPEHDSLIALLREFDSDDVRTLPRWTLAMTAAWFVWRNHDAVLDQLKFARRGIKFDELNRGLERPTYIRQANRRPGFVACVFEEAGLAGGHAQFCEGRIIRRQIPRPTIPMID
jgi:hypothetical protein